jgi:hypothetical protein
MWVMLQNPKEFRAAVPTMPDDADLLAHWLKILFYE